MLAQAGGGWIKSPLDKVKYPYFSNNIKREEILEVFHEPETELCKQSNFNCTDSFLAFMSTGRIWGKEGSLQAGKQQN